VISIFLYYLLLFYLIRIEFENTALWYLEGKMIFDTIPS